MVMIEAVSFFIGMGVGVLMFILASASGSEMRKEITDSNNNFNNEQLERKLHDRGVNNRLDALEQVVFSPKMREKLGSEK